MNAHDTRRAQQLSAEARARIARQIAETTGLTTRFGTAQGSPQ
jgi:hypothetical protein